MSQRSPHHRFIYANGVSIMFSATECFLTFGVKEDPNSPDDKVFEEATIVLTPNTAKLIAELMGRIITATERAIGQVIPVDETKIKQIEDILASAESQRQAANP